MDRDTGSAMHRPPPQLYAPIDHRWRKCGGERKPWQNPSRRGFRHIPVLKWSDATSWWTGCNNLWRWRCRHRHSWCKTGRRFDCRHCHRSMRSGDRRMEMVEKENPYWDYSVFWSGNRGKGVRVGISG